MSSGPKEDYAWKLKILTLEFLRFFAVNFKNQHIIRILITFIDVDQNGYFCGYGKLQALLE